MPPNFEKLAFRIIYYLPPSDIWGPAVSKGKKGNGKTVVMETCQNTREYFCVVSTLWL